MNSKITKYLKIALKAFAALLIFLVILLILLRIPAIQTKLANIAVNIISKATNTEIKIDKVALNFIDNVSAKGVYLSDENGDTLLYAEKLNVDIGIFKLLSNTVDIDYVELSNSKINIYQKQDSTFSFQFLIDAFPSDSTKPESKPWTVEIDKVKIINADYNFDLLQAKNHLKVKELVVKSDEVDFEKMFFSISKIEINQMNLSSVWKDSELNDIQNPEDLTQNNNIPFPLKTLPISIVCQQLEIKESQIKYQKGNIVKSDFFDVNNIFAQKINIQIDDIIVNENEAKLNIDKIQLNLNNQFEIKEANAGLLFSKNEIVLNNLYFKTGKSELQIEGETSYKKFEDLINFKNGTPIDVKLKKLDLAIQEAVYFVPFLDTVSYLDKLKNSNIKLSAFAKGTIDDLAIKSLIVELNNTKLELSGNIKNALDVDQLSFNDFTVKALTNIEQLRTVLGSKIVLSQYNYFGKIDLDAKLDGTLNNLNIQSLKLETDGILSTSLSGQVASLLNIDQLKYNLKVNRIKTGFADLEVLVDSLPELLQKMEYVNYVGDISGGLKNYKVKGNLNTPLGSANSDLSMAFNSDFSNATYEGRISLDQFNLGKLLAVDSLGAVSLNAEIKGEGIALEDLNAEIDAVISQIDFNSYNYKDIKIDGSFIQKQFTGQLNIDDKNLQFDFDGKINLNDSVPDLDFIAALKHINTFDLNLTTFPLIASLNIDANLKGLNVNDIAGGITIDNINLKNEDRTWSTDSITFKAGKNDKFQKAYIFKSSFLNAEIEGVYDVLKLPQIFIATIDQYLAISPILAKDTLAKEPFVLSDENIHLDLSFNHPEDFVSFFNIDLKKLDTAFLHLAFDAPNSVFDLEFFIPALQFGNIYVDSIYWKADGKNDIFDNEIRIDSISFTESIYIPGFQSIARFENQQGYFNNFINDNNNKYSLAINTNLKSANEQITIDIQSPLILNGKDWNVENNDEAYISNTDFYIPKFSLSNGAEKLAFNYSNDSKFIDFTNFNLNNFTDLIEIDSTEISGIINGVVSIETHEDHLDAKGKINVDNIKVNDLKVGDLVLDVTQKDKDIIANIDLKDGGNYLNVNAKYNTEIGETNAEVRLFKFNLSTIGPIVQDFADNLGGYLTGNIKILKSANDLSVKGTLDFTNVEALIVPLGTTYKIAKGSLVVDNNSISPDFNITDEINRNAYLKGTINHQKFSDFKFDLVFNTTAFTFLNSKKKEDDLIYGKLVAKVNAKITGRFDLPKIKGDITTIDESDLSIQLLSQKSIATQEQFVIFLNGSDFNELEIDSIANEKYKINSSIDLDLTVNINEKATLRVVIDPLTGDNLVVNGNGTLTVKMPPYGDIDITGVYTVNSGLYSFSFQQLLRKKFEITKGSQLKFAGSPMNATLSIQAAYNTDVSTYALVENEAATLSSDEKQALKKKVEASVLLNMNGKLSEPKLSFDIKMADNSGGPVGGAVTRALNRIKQNESELNKQVFSLLLFNSFTGTSNSGNISSSSTSTAVRSVGNLISSQLNKLAGKAEGLEINFNLDQYQDQFSDNGNQITDVELGISQSLFNDKIVISIGGNVGLESGQSENGALSNVAGDFVLTYKITDDGKYNIKVFQKSDYDALNDANVWKTGAGFSYHTKFGRLRKKGRK